MQASVSAFIHTGVCYLSAPHKSLIQFSGSSRPPATALLAHVYGIKNFYTSLIRSYAAYHIDNTQLYDLAIFTFVGVLFLYATETWVWNTVRLREAVFPFVTAGLGLAWMVTQRSFYVG